MAWAEWKKIVGVGGRKPNAKLSYLWKNHKDILHVGSCLQVLAEGVKHK